MKNINIDSKKFKDDIAEKEYYEKKATEKEFLKWYKEKKEDTYKKASHTVDIIAFKFIKTYLKRDSGYIEDKTFAQVLMIERGQHPYKDKLAFPGGFMRINETLEMTVIREMREETSVDLKLESIEQLKTVSSLDRDPRGRVITTPYLCFIPFDQKVVVGDDAKNYKFITILSKENTIDEYRFVEIDDKGNVIKEYKKEEFGFDHFELLKDACVRIGNKLDYNPIILKVFNNRGFTIREASEMFAAFNSNYIYAKQSNFKRDYQKLFIPTENYVERMNRKAQLFEFIDIEILKNKRR